jgi:molecular chaperone DnaK
MATGGGGAVAGAGAAHAAIANARRRRCRARTAVPASALLSREFHGTPPARVLPIIVAGIGVAVAATGVRYVIRAGRRMKQMEKEEAEQRARDGFHAAVDPEAEKAAAAALVPAFGVDLGTTSVRLASSDAADKFPMVVENREGFRVTPAALSVVGGGQPPIFGQVAWAQRFQSPDTTVTGLQRHLWQGSDCPAMGSSDALAEMLKGVKDLMVHKVAPGGSAVLSSPAHFEDKHRALLVEAGSQAGLNVLGTIDEPIAAVTAAAEMGILKGEGSKQRVAVVDVGGLGMACSIVAPDDSGAWQLLGTQHSEEAGGELFDEALVAKLTGDFKATYGIDLLTDPLARLRLHEAAEAAKVELSKGQSTLVNLPYITADATGPKHLSADFNRSAFERCIERPLHAADVSIREALNLAGLGADGLSAVLLVGGCGRMPSMQTIAERNLGATPGKLVIPEHSEELVVLGAAIHARKQLYGK